MTTFLRLLEADADEKGTTLADAARRWRSGSEPDGIFEVEPASLGQVPGSPFAYWVSERVRRLFTELPAFEGDGRTVKQGLATADDFRFVRCWWEPDATSLSGKWVPFAKGGTYSPFYADLHLVVHWAEGGREAKAWASRSGDHWSRRLAAADYYFRPGLTWPLRKGRFTPVSLPSGTVFSVRGYAAFTSEDDLLATMAVFSSRPFDQLFKLLLGRFEFPEFVVGQLQVMPWRRPDSGVQDALAELAARAYELERSRNTASHVDHSFILPRHVQTSGPTLSSRAGGWSDLLWEVDAALLLVQSQIDDIAFSLYGIHGEDRRQMEEGFGALGPSKEDADVPDEDDENEAEGADPVALTESLMEWALGAALGRFDTRLATGERQPPPVPDPFDPLPVCSPGMLQDENGLPAREPPAGYPLALPPHRILVDDPGHPWDVVTRIEAVFDLVAGDRGHAWIQEAEEILGRDLRDWLRRYGFERHLKRYSRSRRKAPLFWHLAPKSREYGIWLYSPAATRDTFYRIQRDYVDPKLKAAERRLLELRQHAGASPTGQQRKDLTAQESLVEDLRTFGEQVALVAPLWRSLRDDGVVLNCAVLSRLFDHHRTWQRECAKKWGELADGKYDWAGWAMHLWPERVVATCAADRSIAIAHGLEEALWREGEDGKWKPRPDAETEIDRLVAERRSQAIEAALEAYERAG